MDVKYKRLIEEIKEGKVKSAYLLLGKNDFLKDEFVKVLESQTIDKKFESTDKLITYGKSCTADVISWLMGSPFGSKRKFCIIRHADLLSPKVKKAIQNWIDHPTKGSTLVLLSDKPEFKNCASCNCWELFKHELSQWVKSFAKEMGFNITIPAIELLHQILGTDLYAISTEIKKIMNFIEPKRTIELSDVQSLGGKELTGSIFDLTHAIGEKNPKKAQHLLKLLFALGESPGRILWMIYQHFGKLSRLKESPNELLGVPKFYLSKYKSQVTLWSTDNLLNVFSYLFETDFAIKTGKGKIEFLLEELIYKLCSINS